MINFLRFKYLYLLASALIIVVGLFAIIKSGLNYSIDFTGGSILEYRFKSSVDEAKLQKALEKNKAEVLSIEKSGKTTYIIKTQPLNEKIEADFRKSDEFKKMFGTPTLLQFETVGPSVGREMTRKTLLAAALGAMVILLYMTYAFKKITHGIAAVLAMIHDFLVLIGIYAVLGLITGAEVDTLFVTALLTTMSFSVHDTIVVFDKIREYQKKTMFDIEALANQALTETMVRSINNSLTIMLMLFPLVLFAGDEIRFFAAALLIGTITGTYSSPFVATPLLVFLEKEKS